MRDVVHSAQEGESQGSADESLNEYVTLDESHHDGPYFPEVIATEIMIITTTTVNSQPGLGSIFLDISSPWLVEH